MKFDDEDPDPNDPHAELRAVVLMIGALILAVIAAGAFFR